MLDSSLFRKQLKASYFQKRETERTELRFNYLQVATVTELEDPIHSAFSS